MTINYINLTNGIEAIPNIEGEYRFIRIQSSLCERHMWDRLIQDLDYDLLMHLALGDTCIIWDYGARKPVPRAVYQGLEFIKYVLYKRWLQLDYIAVIKKEKNAGVISNCSDYFEGCYGSLGRKAKRKLDYFLPFVKGKLCLQSVTDYTIHDGDKEYYNTVLARTRKDNGE